MKTALFLLASFVSFNLISAQTNSPIFDFIKANADNENVTSVFIGPSMTKMLLSSEDDDEELAELQELFKDFQGMRILVIEDGAASEVYKKFKSTVSLDRYEELMSVRDGDETVKIIGMPKGDGFSEVGMIVSESDELVIMSFLGTITKDQLGKLNKAFDLDMDDVFEN